MGRIITVASAKGGVGKTTTVLNLGYGLSRLAGRVLLVDADPQGGLANASNLRARSPHGLIDVLAGRAALQEAIFATRDPALSILGSGDWTLEDTALYEEAAQLGTLTRLIQETGEHYDTVLVDAPAGHGTVVQALLKAADGLLLPINSRSLAIKSLPLMLRVLQQLQAGAAPGLGLEGILITDRDAASGAQWEIFEELRRSLPAGALYRTVIPHDDQVERASMRSLPVALLTDGPSQRAADAYMQLAAEFKTREANRTRPLGGATEESEDEHVGLF